MIHPYKPSITLQDLLAYNPEDPTTHTPSPLMNALAEILQLTKLRDAQQIADLLEVDKLKLSFAIELETEMSLKVLITQFRLEQIKLYMAEHPDLSSTQVAQDFDFPSKHAFWRFFQINTGVTPEGKKSDAPKIDNYSKMVRRIREWK